MRIDTAIARVAADLAQRQAALAKSTSVSGLIRCTGPNIDGKDGDGVETEIDILFPVEFTQRPSVVFGAELAADSSFTAGMIPIVNPILLSWNTVTRGVEQHYQGARIGIVVTGGPVGTKCIVNWVISGQALVGANPDGD